MSDKGDLLSEIANKMKRKEDLKKEVAARNSNIEEFAMKMITDMEDMIASATNTSLLVSLVPLYADSFQGRVKIVDSGATVDIQWIDGKDGIPRISGILIKWSKQYQQEQNCEEQLYVDPASLLLN